MRVKILVEFEVNTEEEELAKWAAESAVWDHLCLSNTGESVVDDVDVHVDGHGGFTVKIVEGT